MKASNFPELINLRDIKDPITDFTLGNYGGSSMVSLQIYWSNLDGFDSTIQVLQKNSEAVPVWNEVPTLNYTLDNAIGSCELIIAAFAGAIIGVRYTKNSNASGIIGVLLLTKDNTPGAVYNPGVGDNIKVWPSNFFLGLTDAELRATPLDVNVVNTPLNVSITEPVTIDGEVTVKQSESDLSTDGLTTAQLLEKAMDKSEVMPIQVQLPKDLKQAPDGGLLTPMSVPYFWNSTSASQPLIIDCTGYQSVLVSKSTAGVVTPTVSNNGITYSATLAIASATSIPAATILTAAGNYVLPVVSRYLKLTGPASAVSCAIYLSQTPCLPLLNTPINFALFGGTAVVNGGVAGLQGVGGNIAPGTAPTANPVPIGVVDDSRVPITRRLVSDRLGKLLVATHGERISTVNETGFTPEYKNVLDVHDADKSEGNSVLDLLTAVLIELKIANQYLFELPRLIDSGGTNMNEPCEFRNDKEATQCL